VRSGAHSSGVGAGRRLAVSALDSNSLLTVVAVAQRLQVSECWVRRHQQQLGCVRVGGSVRFYWARVESYVRSNSSQVIVLPTESPSREPKGEIMFSRRYQEGCVFKQGKEKPVWIGKWRVDQLTADGQIVRRQVKRKLGTLKDLPTKTDARRAMQAAMGDTSKPKPASLRFPELVTRWSQVVGPTLKHSSFTHYSDALRGVTPAFQSLSLEEIDRYMVGRFIQSKAARYSRATLKSFRTSLSLVLGWAVSCGWIDKNPVAGIRLPRQCGGTRVERQALTEADALRLAEALVEPYSTLVLLLYSTGLRISEACALTWQDLEDASLRIERRLYGGKVDEVKTRGSSRRLPLPPPIHQRLLSLRKANDVDSSWIFQASNGRPLTPTNIRTRHLRPTAKRLGIRIGGLHDFRHTVTQRLRRAGVHPKVVASLLGHSQVSLAMDVYDHVDESDLRPALEKVSGHLVLDGTQRLTTASGVVME